MQALGVHPVSLVFAASVAGDNRARHGRNERRRLLYFYPPTKKYLIILKQLPKKMVTFC